MVNTPYSSVCKERETPHREGEEVKSGNLSINAKDTQRQRERDTDR